MDKLQSMRSFLQVADDGSFARAADRIGISHIALSRRVTWLEEQLGIRLLVRTSRRLSLTDCGRAYRDSARSILAKLDDVERSMSKPVLKPMGTLRVAVSAIFPLQRLASCVRDYHSKYPDVLPVPLLADRPFDLVGGGYDVGIMDLSLLSCTSLIARPIPNAPFIACASPSYIKRCGEPTHPEQLTDHSYIVMSGSHSGNSRLQISGPGGSFRLNCKPMLIVNNADFLVQMILAGTAVGFAPPELVLPEIRKGTLKSLLPGYSARAPSIGIVYPNRRYLPAKVRTFVDYFLATCDTASATPDFAVHSHNE